jgi:hypothetical protein
MPYNVTIQDYETKKPVDGWVYYYDSGGNEIGMSTVHGGYTDLEENAAWPNTTHIQVTAAGYSSYGTDTDTLHETTIFYLVRKGNSLASYLVGGLVVYVGMRLLAKRSTKIL